MEIEEMFALGLVLGILVFPFLNFIEMFIEYISDKIKTSKK
jgi:hypothetical protein